MKVSKSSTTSGRGSAFGAAGAGGGGGGGAERLRACTPAIPFGDWTPLARGVSLEAIAISSSLDVAASSL